MWEDIFDEGALCGMQSDGELQAGKRHQGAGGNRQKQVALDISAADVGEHRAQGREEEVDVHGFFVCHDM